MCHLDSYIGFVLIGLQVGLPLLDPPLACSTNKNIQTLWVASSTPYKPYIDFSCRAFFLSIILYWCGGATHLDAVGFSD